MKIQRSLLGGKFLLLAAFAMLLLGGCNRAYYRRQADRDAYGLVQEKAQHPHWKLPDYTIRLDPRSRMFDPGSPDCPALPPDDPCAHELMHCVDGKRGYPDWHKDGETDTAENPNYLAYLEFDDKGQLQITADDSIRVGLLNSRNYQLQLEELYLSALDVSFERFRFDAQFFAGYATTYTADGPNRPGGGGNSSSELNARLYSTGQRPWAMQKLFTTGGTLVVGLANQLVWQFSGPNNYTPTTLIDFSLVQPLMRNAGRDRVMERLTVAERTLLANVRAMEQYRQAFYVEVMTGRSAGNGPNRRGGVFGSGLEGFTGVGTGFGNVGGNANNANASASGAAGAGAAAIGGYLGLLQNQQDIRNQENNIQRLRANLFRLQEFLQELRTRTGEEGLVNNILRQDLQVAQARQALFNAESRLLNSRNNYQASVDNFTNTLGLPPTLCLAIRDSLLDQFQLVDPITYQETNELDTVTAAFGQVRQRIIDHILIEQSIDPNDPSITRVVQRLPNYDGLADDLAELKTQLDEIMELRARLMEEHLPRINEDLDAFVKARAERKKSLVKLQEKVKEAGDELCSLLPIPTFNRDVFNTKRLDDGVADLRSKLQTLEAKIDDGYERHVDARKAKIDALLKKIPADEEEIFDRVYKGILYPRTVVGQENRSEITDIIVDLPGDLLALQLIQARARTESIELAPVDLRAEQAIMVAAKYRRDLMNARAALVDTWRLIRFNADQLESSLDIVFSGDISNFGDNPLNLQSNTGRLRAGFQFDAPLTRLSERNTYRQALIEYQQARRTYYAFEDTVARTLRAELRTISANQLNFELQRLAVLEAARQVDRNEDIRIDQELTGQASGATAARDAVSALTDLLDAQNNFMSIWVNYEAQRRYLDLDLGTMQLDSEGIWIDPEKIGPDYGSIDPWERCVDEQRALDGDLPDDVRKDLEALPEIEGQEGAPPKVEVDLNEPLPKPQPKLQPPQREPLPGEQMTNHRQPAKLVLRGSEIVPVQEQPLQWGGPKVNASSPSPQPSQPLRERRGSDPQAAVPFPFQSPTGSELRPRATIRPVTAIEEVNPLRE